MSWLTARWRRLRKNQGGYAAILVATLIPTVFMGCAAVSVDTARWYVAGQQMQQAADAAALAGVPYLPYDMPSATAKALSVAANNGFSTSNPNVTVTVGLGVRETQLKVTITAKVRNTFGAVIGVTTETLSRSAVADYQGPQPMGSPCNTFGNEPTAGTGGSSPTPSGSALGSSPFANCSSTPQFWANIEGPQVDKIQGDQYQDLTCTSGVDGCTGTSNNEYNDFGYVFVVKVQQAAVGTPVNLQLYDPEFAPTSKTSGGVVLPCGNLPGKSSYTGTGNLNPWVTVADAQGRYSSDSPNSTTPTTSNSFCPGDSFPGGTGTPLITTFVLRHQVESQNADQAAVENDTAGSPCIKQYGGISAAPSSNQLTVGKSGYDAQLAQVFHNWTSLCTFTPDVAGDYYLQVRSNVSTGGTGSGMLWSGNSAASALTGNTTTGFGSNAYAMRAVTLSGKETSVAVAGYSHMPISINADAATATFNLIRVLPGAAGQFISFGYFDAGDSQGSGAVKVLPPTDATGSITTNPFPGNCSAVGGSAGTTPGALSSCSAPFVQSGGVSKNNGKLETITVPIPSDYTCNFASFGGCWYRVQISFGSGSVHDVTTWNATVVGDPVRLIE
jgi:Flp pilus assembly protein TadG